MTQWYNIFLLQNNSEYVNIKFMHFKVASDVSAIHPTSWRNSLASETKLSTPFKKILATPL